MRRSVAYSVAAACCSAPQSCSRCSEWGTTAAALTDGQALVLGVVQGADRAPPDLVVRPPRSSSRGSATGRTSRSTTTSTRRSTSRSTSGTLVAVGGVLLARHRATGRRVARHAAARRRIETADERIAWFVLVATIPAGVVGLARRGRDRRPSRRAVADRDPARRVRAPALAGPTARRRAAAMGDLGLRQALVMGLAQALALAPGVSRSGITITAGRFMKLDRDAPRASRSCCSSRRCSAPCC